MARESFELNFRHLQALPALAEKGRLGAAAESVGLSQPALTQGLAKLEHQLGRRLFLRRADGVLPTAEAALLIARVRSAVLHLAAAARGRRRGFAHPETLMTSTQLRAFLALAEAGSFRGAGVAMGISQPACHRSVRDLEQIVGTPLTDRRGRGVVLTEAGRRLARGVRLASGEIASGLDEIGARLAASPIVRIGAMPLCRARLLPHAAVRFGRVLPQAQLCVVEGSWTELVEQLRDGALDLMIGALRPPEEVPDLCQSAFFEDSLAIICRPAHPLVRCPNVTLPDLAAYPWIVGRAGSPLRLMWEGTFAPGTRPAAPVECGSVITIREMLRQTDFLTLLSPDQVGAELASGLLTVAVTGLPGCVRRIGVILRKDWRPAPAQAAFLRLLEEAGREPRRLATSQGFE